MRLDAYLKAAGLIRRRSLAREFCEAGAVRVNGQPAKAGKGLRVGDEVTVETWGRYLLLEVTSLPLGSSAKGEKAGYRVLEDRRKET
jgi:ribosomal 50S subunit-recycling heat shock protein